MLTEAWAKPVQLSGREAEISEKCSCGGKGDVLSAYYPTALLPPPHATTTEPQMGTKHTSYFIHIQ